VSERILKGKYFWGTVFALFLVACGVKWFYLAQQHYHILLSEEAFGAYHLADTVALRNLVGRLFSPATTLGVP